VVAVPQVGLGAHTHPQVGREDLGEAAVAFLQGGTAGPQPRAIRAVLPGMEMQVEAPVDLAAVRAQQGEVMRLAALGGNIRNLLLLAGVLITPVVAVQIIKSVETVGVGLGVTAIMVFLARQIRAGAGEALINQEAAQIMLVALVALASSLFDIPTSLAPLVRQQVLQQLQWLVAIVNINLPALARLLFRGG